MRKYNVFYKGIRIGILYIDPNEHNSYCYVADGEKIKEVEEKEDVVIIPDCKTDRPFGPPIPFFERRISNCRKFGEFFTIKYPNSEYVFVRETKKKN